MTYRYMGYTIEKVGHQQWNISVGDNVIDATDTLAQAKYLIRCWKA